MLIPQPQLITHRVLDSGKLSHVQWGKYYTRHNGVLIVRDSREQFAAEGFTWEESK